ncbi:MAG TPA: dynamin family protein, partial [Bacillota bacterium]|nr:dynamin family protein [Bacillota bacterium]
MEKNEILENKMIATYEVMYKNGDFKNAQKVKEVYQKYNNQFKALSFVGHFSAGKSSLINALLGEDILPESPIPTSANIVKITSGNGSVKVYFSNKEPEEYKEPYDIDMIKDYCMKKG